MFELDLDTPVPKSRTWITVEIIGIGKMTVLAGKTLRATFEDAYERLKNGRILHFDSSEWQIESYDSEKMVVAKKF